LPSDVAAEAAPRAVAPSQGGDGALPDIPVLQVRVVHGSLEFAAEPVAVGHYQGMPLTGAEGFLNDRLRGLLGDRLLLGMYAEQEGSAVLVGPLPDVKPPGALVLGLGPAGEVTTSEVTRAMTQAALLRALVAAEEVPDGASGPATVGMSTVLVGTNPLDGMTISASAAALVEGMVVAIQLLRSTPRLWSKVRLGSLEIIERYEQRAHAAHRAVTSLAGLQAPQGTEVDVRVGGAAANPLQDAEVTVQVAEAVSGGPALGGQPGQPQEDYNDQAWMRVDIRSLDPPPGAPAGCRYIEFTSMGRRARADRLVQQIETSLVNDLIARAIGQARPDPQICNTLYELLVPGELKYELLNADNLHLLLDHDTSCYPWEALAPRYKGGNKPLALRTGVLRQFAEPETRMARFGVRPASGRHVLVIGNPPAGKHGADLPGAAAEARQVAELFASSAGRATGTIQHNVHALIWAEDGPESTNLPEVNDAQSWLHIVNALYRHEYRIIHIAAHGMYNPAEPLRSGVVIGPQDQFLTALTVSQLPVVPELVFLNCCHSGRMGDATSSPGPDPDRKANLLAASVARSLMGVGVRAVVASGWAVDDDAAALFATTFYRGVVEEGRAFGEAVRTTRDLVRRESDSLTWAAYQCYGDPEFRLQASADW
jgi:hypothetical protein